MPIVIDYSQPPTADQVETVLKGMAWWPADDAQHIAAAQEQSQINIVAAVDEWNRRTGWKPFIAGDTATTRTFDSADYDGELDLSGGLWPTPTPLVSVGGQNYVLDQNAFLGPSHAPDENAPFTKLRFYPATRVMPSYLQRPNRIIVTGRWGRYETWPPLAWKAVLLSAVLMTMTTIEQADDKAAISEGPYSYAVDLVGPFDRKTAVIRWPEMVEKYVMTFKRGVA